MISFYINGQQISQQNSPLRSVGRQD